MEIVQQALMARSECSYLFFGWVWKCNVTSPKGKSLGHDIFIVMPQNAMTQNASSQKEVWDGVTGKIKNK